MRNINTVAGYVQLGVTSGFLTPFLFAEYSSSEQSTESGAVGGTNMSGRGYLFGPGIRIDMGKVFLSAIFTPLGSYGLSRQTAAGEATNYLEPSGGLLKLGYTFKSFMIFGMMRYLEYSRVVIGNTSTDINSNKVVHSSNGGGIQWGVLWKF
jgi:hypothetical protein